jgi:hypothetical protein
MARRFGYPSSEPPQPLWVVVLHRGAHTLAPAEGEAVDRHDGPSRRSIGLDRVTAQVPLHSRIGDGERDGSSRIGSGRGHRKGMSRLEAVPPIGTQANTGPDRAEPL